MTPASTKKKVMVIGGGPVGMEAAIVAAKRGHDVTLYEKADRLGGQWLQAAVPPGKELLNTLAVWQKGELERSGAKVTLNQTVDQAFIEQEKPDHIIVATGSTAIVPPIPGIDSSQVYTAEAVLKGQLDLAGHVVVIGGGSVGVETAQHMAVHNQKVTLVEKLPEIAIEMEGGARHFILESLRSNNVTTYVNTKVVEIKEGCVVLETTDGLTEILADQVILAAGSQPDDHLAGKVADQFPTTVIGDASSVGKALEGINSAYATALAI